MSDFEIIVVGGGHAGIEAAWAAARMGCATALITINIEAIGRMSCNPAIGGLAKGQIVREIDAMGGLMGLATDEAGIQFRILNRSKGPAVWAPRAQADRDLYCQVVQRHLCSQRGLTLIEGIVEAIIPEPLRAPSNEPRDSIHGDRPPLQVQGVRLADGRTLRAQAVILTTGTFLCGLMHTGLTQTPGGRIGEPAAMGLSDSLRQLGLVLGRLKTGTPPRVHRDSIDDDRLQVQAGDDPPIPFSFLNTKITQPQVHCWITHTNEQSHELIRANLDRAPLFSGQIKSRGPRYCPSIEDKVVRFPEKPSHQIFLEPEGYNTQRIYCNGIATSLPIDVQEHLVHSIVGLERARIIQFGYAIEYDWVPTDQIDATLETRKVRGLFLAGQINGTSGYEEAAGQGLMAAINAVARLRHREPLILGRDEAYIGVMIDDLVTRPPDEPYRMFTSRAEYRLHLRSDNADQRLTEIGRQVGLVDDTRWQAFQAKRTAIAAWETAMNAHRHNGQSLMEYLRRPETTLRELAKHLPTPIPTGPATAVLDADTESPAVMEAVTIAAKYAGYLDREQRLIERYRQLESKHIPESFDYTSIKELRYEAREKFQRFRPRSLGQAARISGISPADISTLSIYLFHHKKKG